jgi:hypothetical protein
MKLQIIDWNISIWCDANQIITQLDQKLTNSHPTIICLQEVLPRSYKVLSEKFGSDAVAYSLTLRSPGKFEGKNRGMGVAVIGVNCRIDKYALVSQSLFPERAMHANVDAAGSKVGILNFHGVTGKSYYQAKACNFASLASFLHEHEGNIDFACFDANEPKKDYQDWTKVEFYDNGDKGKNAARLLGQKRSHQLSDSLRSYYDASGIVNDSQPLARSHKTKRFDYILHSPKWKVLEVDYPFDESLRATSDHSMVVGVFEAVS